MDGQMHGWMNAWMDGRMEGRTNALKGMCGWTDAVHASHGRWDGCVREAVPAAMSPIEATGLGTDLQFKNYRQNGDAFKITNKTKPVYTPWHAVKTHARNSEWEGKARSRVRTRAMKQQPRSGIFECQ